MNYWNHNVAYYEWIRKETEGCYAILDVGCGDGRLLSSLYHEERYLVGIDKDKTCVYLSELRLKDQAELIHTDFESYRPLVRFDAVIFVASLHHMDMRQALKKARAILNEQGKIIIVGLAKPSSLTDYLIEGLRVIPVKVISLIRHMKSDEDSGIPVSYEMPRMNEVRQVIQELLPGAEIRNGLYYRYLVSWTKND